ncbi:hypothetical protein EMIHUDRAFT_218258 [Emiliania huxleyi CCMP1516]|uniref:DUF155 domain-containing protein n=2 Tax=Emiliania huxleyi TaxID=2903 RepID=A0A0D3I8Y5_EMIH1|nr:hypothetical protein EMIHUDRAFT_218258 [Emiliania huxleyi CCMP1516]EOD07720.1 hypothetical protein EMIHUDRAFT_218258 [Emiliania huxleyi CCMP1516]|eukprot:XP_005760149.1 hypothetical protein EMIHUDRAFT_218258 [Emiliania huxleyi CCMP1516]
MQDRTSSDTGGSATQEWSELRVSLTAGAVSPACGGLPPEVPLRATIVPVRRRRESEAATVKWFPNFPTISAMPDDNQWVGTEYRGGAPARVIGRYFGMLFALALQPHHRPLPERQRLQRSAAITAQTGAPTDDLGGPSLNEELRLSVQYLGGPASRQRRVRRTKRPPPEERWRQSALAWREGHGRCSSYCSFMSIDLDSAIELLEKSERWRAFGQKLSIVSYADVAGPVSFVLIRREQRDAFLFPYGSAGADSEATQLSTTTVARIAALSGEAQPGARRTKIESNVVVLRSADPVEKIAVSFAFAQSVKLSALETALEQTIEERNEANLHSNILDCPDFFWEAEEYEAMYRRVHRYLDDRVAVLNKRLDIVNDLLDSLASQLEIRTAHRLEVTIIVLIMLEIAMELVKGASLPGMVRWPVRLVQGAVASLVR